MIAKMDKDDVAVLIDEKEEENKAEEAKIDESAQGRMIAKMDKDDVAVLMDEKEEENKISHNLWCKPYNKVSLIAALNSFKVTITLQAKVVDPTLGNNKCVPTVSIQVSTASTDVAAASLSHDTVFIINGDAPVTIALVSGGAEAAIPPKTTEQKIARRNELKAKSTMLLAIIDEHLLKFMESRMQRPYGKLLRPGLNKTYDRFQKLISQLEFLCKVISQEDANLKLLRSLPPAWNTHTLIMQNKSNLDTLSMEDLYKNLKVYESEIKCKSSASLNSQNVAFVSLDNTSSINEAVNTAHDVSAASSQGQDFSSTYDDDVMFSFFANQSNSLQLDNEDLEQIDTNDLEEMDLKWQVAMLTIRTKVECYNFHKRGHFARECRVPRSQGNRNGDNTRRVVPVETPANALVVTDGMGYDWSYQAEEGPTEFALMAHSPSDKIGLGYDSQMSEKDLNNKSNVFESASDSNVNESEEDNNQANDRYKASKGYHTVPPSYTRNFMPPRPDLSFARLDDSIFKSAMSETVTSVHETETSVSKSSKESMEKPKTVRKNFVPSAAGKAVNAARQSFSRAATSTSTARYVNTAASRPTMNVNTACYVYNKVLVTKPHNKAPYELLTGRSPNLDFMRSFGCPVTILNTLDHLGKFEGKADERFLVGYSINSKAFRVFNSRTRKVKENLHIRFLENKSNVAEGGPEWLFDIDSLTKSINYEPVTSGNQTNNDAVLRAQMIRMLMRYQAKEMKVSLNINNVGSNDPSMPSLEETGIFNDVYDDREVGVEANTNNLELSTVVSPIPTTRVHKNHPKKQIIGDLNLATQTRRMINFSKENGMVKQKDDGIFISQDKYVADLLKKFDFTTVKTSSTLMEPHKALVKDAKGEDVDVHLYKLMIGSLMYITASRPDIVFVVCACARFQVTPKTLHLHVVMRMFRYLKGQPKLDLWYPRDSPFDLESFSDNDYAGDSLDRKSTIEYVAAANCYGQVLWIQNQMLDYGFNFMNIKIYIDNESIICIMKNQCFILKTKHIEIRHHFIRDSYEKKLIQVIKIHTDHNVADLLTKDFDVSRFIFLIVDIGLLNL
nr:hypothetical protein [Tanacetum cinerariifolium]